MTTFEELKSILANNPTSGLQIRLPDSESVPAHFHITEVGYVTKDFIDCGGTRRTNSSCVLQTLVANDVEHRLPAGKLAAILDLSDKVISDPSVPVEMEYDTGTTSSYALEEVGLEEENLIFSLSPKHTACLAPDKCGIEDLMDEPEPAAACEPSDGC